MFPIRPLLLLLLGAAVASAITTVTLPIPVSPSSIPIIVHPGFTRDTGTLTVLVNPEDPTKTLAIAKTGFATCTTKKGQHGEHPGTATTSSRAPEHTHVRRAAAMRFWIGVVEDLWRN